MSILWTPFSIWVLRERLVKKGNVPKKDLRYILNSQNLKSEALINYHHHPNLTQYMWVLCAIKYQDRTLDFLSKCSQCFWESLDWIIVAWAISKNKCKKGGKAIFTVKFMSSKNGFNFEYKASKPFSFCRSSYSSKEKREKLLPIWTMKLT